MQTLRMVLEVSGLLQGLRLHLLPRVLARRDQAAEESEDGIIEECGPADGCSSSGLRDGCFRRRATRCRQRLRSGGRAAGRAGWLVSSLLAAERRGRHGYREHRRQGGGGHDSVARWTACSAHSVGVPAVGALRQCELASDGRCREHACGRHVWSCATGPSRQLRDGTVCSIHAIKLRYGLWQPPCDDHGDSNAFRVYVASSNCVSGLATVTSANDSSSNSRLR
mmetsp:Transcript_146463/g.255444  ORF Transcript_146463/g.255444 Transcript_146463/m.255444 type:complete len:224 (+) Transcript_146463:284-955(+)